MTPSLSIGFWFQADSRDFTTDTSDETTLPDFDGLVIIPHFVMPDLIRYPEYAEIT
jgi:hypothetical protein